MLRSDHMRAGTREAVNAPDSRYAWLRLAICTLIYVIVGNVDQQFRDHARGPRDIPIEP